MRGYKELFRIAQDESAHHIHGYGGYQVRVALALYTDDRNQADEVIQEYWYDSPKGILEQLIAW